MLFNSWTFALFALVVFPVYYSLSHRWQNRFLLVASYFFYGMWDWRFLGLIVISTVIDYLTGLGIEGSPSPRGKKWFLVLSLATNLGILGFFKYCNFFIQSTADLLEIFGLNPQAPVLAIILPIGISFYTFQTLSYTIDIYRGQQRATKDLLSFAVYVAFFPQLVAGPIERARRLLPQILAPRKFRAEDWTTGVQLVFWGYVKKVAVGDSLGHYVNQVHAFDGTPSSLVLWLGMYAFALQIYCDFSGYTDIARGLGRLMGIRIMENFRQPLLAPNITELWRRWHISLTSWLMDYLYIPLGGNRKGEPRTSINIIVTFTIIGLWHGANWTFVAWGLMNGIFLAIHRGMVRGHSIPRDYHPATGREWLVFVPKVIVTFHLFALGAIFFRCASVSDVYWYVRGMLGMGVDAVVQAPPHIFDGFPDALVFYGIVVLLMDIGCWRKKQESPVSDDTVWWTRGVVYALGLLMLVLVREESGQAFYYFQF